jgi:hypothetical protein
LSGVGSTGHFVAAVTSPDSLRSILAELGPLSGPAFLGDRPLLIAFGTALVGTNAGCCALNVAADKRRETYSQQIGLCLRESILGALLVIPYGRFSQRNSGDVLNNVNTERFSRGVLLPSRLYIVSGRGLQVCEGHRWLR